MRGKRNLFALLCISIILVLSGCQQAPDTVKEKAKEYQKAVDVEETDAKYVSIDHILDNQDELLSKTYQNLEFRDTVHLEQPDSVSVLSLAIAKSFGSKEKLGDICLAFFGSDQYREEIIRIEDHPAWPDQGIFAFNQDAEDDKDSATVSDNGFLACTRKDSAGLPDAHRIVCHVDWNENMDAIYELGGEPVSIREAVDFVNDWCAENWTAFEPEYSYQVKTVYVCEAENKGNYYSFDVCKFYKGMPFDDIDFYVDDKVYIRNSLDVEMEHKNELSFFRNNDVSYDIVKEELHNDKLIGLEQAILLVQEKMSGSRKFEIIDIDLKYVVCSDLTEDEAIEAHTSIVAPGNPATARPVWSFILDYQPTKEDLESDLWPRTFINVDMINGEILYRDSI